TLRLKPKFFYAYEMAVSPDASRVVLDTRTRYSESNENFSLLADLNLNCSTTVEVVEYGRYVLDTRNGTANYELRSQLVTSPARARGCRRRWRSSARRRAADRRLRSGSS